MTFADSLFLYSFSRGAAPTVKYGAQKQKCLKNLQWFRWHYSCSIHVNHVFLRATRISGDWYSITKNNIAVDRQALFFTLIVYLTLLTTINNTNILTNDRHSYVEGLWVVNSNLFTIPIWHWNVVVNSQNELLLTCSWFRCQHGEMKRRNEGGAAWHTGDPHDNTYSVLCMTFLSVLDCLCQGTRISLDALTLCRMG